MCIRRLAEGDSEYGLEWDPYMGYVRGLTATDEGECAGYVSKSRSRPLGTARNSRRPR